MSGVTTNYGLILPDPGEAYDVAITNSNNTEIDKQIKINADKIKKATKIAGWAGNSATWGTSAHLVLATADFQILPGTFAGNTDASGYVGIDLPYSFPNGYYVVSLSNGDIAAQANINIALSTGIFTNTAARFYVGVKVANTGAALASAAFRVNYLVVGY